MLRPILDWVVIARDDAEEQSPGGIVIPDSAQQKVTRGSVLAVGPGTREQSALADALGESIDKLRELTNGDLSKPVQEFVIEVERVQRGLRRLAPQLREGDRVLFGKYTGNEVTVRDRDGNARECIVTRDAEVYGVIET
jgi:co-chaperonin GroES (HSP10)